LRTANERNEIPDNYTIEKDREIRETTGIRGEGKDMGEHDARFIDTLSDVAEKAADSISHKLHPMVEQYAQLFKTGIRTPVLRRPSDIGLAMKTSFSVAGTASRWRPGSFQLIRTSC
jgi:hypothetical protein